MGRNHQALGRKDRLTMRVNTVERLVVRGADVIDGSGAPRFAADVVVANGLIVGVLAPGKGAADRVIDADGMVVCPGFIDSHSHDDRYVSEESDANPKLAQGVCTVVTGNCGISLAPLVTAEPPAPLDVLGRDAYTFSNFTEYFAALDLARPAVNVAALVGHISLRVKHVDDLNRTATQAEIRAMRLEVHKALEAGAFGLSTGVYYPPAEAASTAELLGVCAALEGRDAILAMHLRDEADNVESALAEALDVGARCKARLVISHHKVMGTANHGRTAQTLLTIGRASALQAVCLDCYPYEASSTMLDAAKAARTGNVLITWSQPHPEEGGRSLQSIAQSWGVDLAEAAARLMPGGAIYFSLSADDVDRVLRHPLTMIGSDGLPHDQRPHPRLWGTFPRVLGTYSRERGLFPLETAVHKMTGLPAQRFGLRGRGLVAAGNAADLVVFDPSCVGDRATYEHPLQAPVGIYAVLVNGQIAWREGRQVNGHAGRRLIP
jgi:N-acyl-D-amino-acid deacylase